MTNEYKKNKVSTFWNVVNECYWSDESDLFCLKGPKYVKAWVQFDKLNEFTRLLGLDEIEFLPCILRENDIYVEIYEEYMCDIFDIDSIEEVIRVSGI